MAAADGRIVLQLDDGRWCHVRNPSAYAVIDTGWFFTPTSRDDVPKVDLPYCPMPDGFYQSGPSIYYLGYTAPQGPEVRTFYNVKFSSAYCRFKDVPDQKRITSEAIGIGPGASDSQIAANVFVLGEDGNIGEGRKFLGDCVNAADPNANNYYIPPYQPPPPAWLLSPSSETDQLRRILMIAGDRSIENITPMSADDVRNTMIVVMINNSRESVSFYQGLNNRALAGLAGLRAYVKGGGRSTTGMSADDIRNTAISDLVSRGRGTVAQYQGMDN